MECGPDLGRRTPLTRDFFGRQAKALCFRSPLLEAKWASVLEFQKKEHDVLDEILTSPLDHA